MPDYLRDCDDLGVRPGRQVDWSFSFNGTNTITRTDLRSWAEFGFANGEPVTVDGVPAGNITISGLTGDILTVSGIAAPAACLTLPGTCTTTVAVYDASLTPNNPIRLGGNDITV